MLLNNDLQCKFFRYQIKIKKYKKKNNNNNSLIYLYTFNSI